MGTSALCDVGTHQPVVAMDLLAPSDRAVICGAKPLGSYLLADLIKRHMNKLILLLLSV